MKSLITLRVTNNSNKIVVAIAAFKSFDLKSSYHDQRFLYPALLCPFLKTRPIGHLFLEKRKPSACKVLPLCCLWRHGIYTTFPFHKAWRSPKVNLPLAWAERSKRPEAAEQQPGQCLADPAEAGNTPQKKSATRPNPIRIVPKLAKGQNLLSACRNASAGRCRSLAEAKHRPTSKRP